MKGLLTFDRIPSIVGRYLVVHPIFFSAFPILFLYTHNIGHVSPSQVCIPLLYSALGTLLLWLMLVPVVKTVHKAGLAAALFTILFFSYGRFYELLQTWGIFVPSHGHLLPGLLLIWAYCVYVIKIAKTDFHKATTILSIMSVTLIVLNLFTIVSYQLKEPQLSHSQPAQQQEAELHQTRLPGSNTMPDIYYIILDEYANPDTMMEYYSYDSSDFVNYLLDRGIFIAHQSRSPSMVTYRSIATSLNMEYIADTDPAREVLNRIEYSQVAGFLRSQGYRFIYFGSWHDNWLGYKVDADISYNFYESSGEVNMAGQFTRILANSTMLAPFYDYLTEKQTKAYYAGAVTDTIKCLREMPGLEGPNFIFAHIVCPHDPFVFDEHGGFVNPSNWTNWRDKQFYLDQYIFITKQIKNVIDSLLTDSRTPPIIIIQSDHGIRPTHPGVEIGENEWQNIFNTYYMPQNGAELLYDCISPANSFRIIFNYYFGTEYELLEDQE